MLLFRTKVLMLQKKTENCEKITGTQMYGLFGYFYLATSISTAYVSRYIPQLIVHLSMDCVSLNDVIIRITSIVIIFFTKYVGIVIHIDKP